MLRFSGPVEGILIVCGLYLVTGAFGPQIWQWQVADLDLSSVGGPPLLVLTLSKIYLVIGVPALYFNILQAIANVLRYYRARKNLAPAQQAAAISHLRYGLVPFFAYYALVAALVATFPLLPTYGFPLLILIGLTVAFLVGRVILAHLTMQQFPYVQAPMLLPVAQLVVVKALVHVYGFAEHDVLGAVMWTGLGLTLGIHAMFVTEMIYEITTYLDLYTLRIKHKQH